MNLDEEFRALVFKYGITSVIEYSENYVKRTYEEINKLHTRLFVKVPVGAQKVVEETPIKVEESTKEVVKNVEPVDVDAVEDAIEETATTGEPVKKPKKCVKKVKPAEKVEEKPVEVPEEVPEESTIGDVSESDEDSVEEDQAKDVDVDEKKRKEEEKREQNRIAKRKQTEAQRKTFEENKSKGINPYDMLTKVNLEKWLIDEERTYADIAQNIVGCSDKDVSLAAKQFDVKSKYIGENGMIKVGRKKKKVTAGSE
jgi:hypothetical protein